MQGMAFVRVSVHERAKRDAVETGLAVAEHEVARKAGADYELTLHQAAVLIQLDDDPDAVKELRKVAKKKPAAFDHEAQRLIGAKATRDEIAKTRAEYEANGVTVVDWPAWNDPDTAFLRDLRTGDGEPLTEENYAGKPGHAVAVGESWRGVAVEHVVVNWKLHGLRKLTGTGSTAGRKLTEEEKATRREVITNNKAWDSAEKGRRTWLTNLLSRKRLPADALAFAATVLASRSHEVGRAVQSRHRIARLLLGLDQTVGDDPLAGLIEKTPNKAENVTFALALGALEGATHRHTWRNPTEAARAYFQQLSNWGYNLAEVEQFVTATDTRTDSADDAARDSEPPRGFRRLRCVSLPGRGETVSCSVVSFLGFDRCEVVDGFVGPFGVEPSTQFRVPVRRVRRRARDRRGGSVRPCRRRSVTPRGRCRRCRPPNPPTGRRRPR